MKHDVYNSPKIVEKEGFLFCSEERKIQLKDIEKVPHLKKAWKEMEECKEKKTKRILALIGVILLVGLYITTLVLAIVDSSATMDLFRGSIFATVVIPTIIWAYTYIYQLFSKKKDHDDSDSTEKND